jgi:hypothetical protein
VQRRDETCTLLIKASFVVTVNRKVWLVVTQDYRGEHFKMFFERQELDTVSLTLSLDWGGKFRTEHEQVDYWGVVALSWHRVVGLRF